MKNHASAWFLFCFLGGDCRLVGVHEELERSRLRSRYQVDRRWFQVDRTVPQVAQNKGSGYQVDRIRFQVDSLVIQVDRTGFQVAQNEGSRCQVDGRGCQVDTMSIQVDRVSVQVDSFAVQVDRTTSQVAQNKKLTNFFANPEMETTCQFILAGCFSKSSSVSSFDSINSFSIALKRMHHLCLEAKL